MPSKNGRQSSSVDDEYVGLNRLALLKKESSKSGLEHLSIGNLLDTFRRHFGIFLGILLIGSASVVFLHHLLPSYRARSTLVLQAAINNPLQSLSTRLGGFSGFDVDGREVDRYLARLRVFSFYQQLAMEVKNDAYFRGLADEIIYRSKPLSLAIRDYFQKHHYGTVGDMDDDELANRLSEIVTFSKDGIDSVSIHIIAIDKELVFKLNELVTQSTVKTLIAYEVRDLDDSDIYLKMQARKAINSIRSTEEEIAEFKKEKKLFSMGTAFDFSAQRSGEMRRELSEIELQLKEIELESRKLNEQKKHEPLTEGDNDYRFGTSRKLSNLSTEREALKLRQDTLKKSLSSLYKNVDERSEQRIFELKGKIDLENSLYQELKKHDFQMEMRRISAKNKFRVLDSARMSSIQPSESLSTKLTVVLAISVILSMSVAYLIEKAFPLIRGLSDLQNLGFLVLGDIPNGRTKKLEILRSKKKSSTRDEIFTPFMQEEIANALIHIRGKVLRLTEKGSPASKGKIVVVSSTEEGEGKSFTSRRLASSLADARNKVLLVDGDLRSPALSQRLGGLHKPGLTEVLKARDVFGVAKIQLEPGLDFLPAGTKHEGATRLISSDDFEQLIKTLAELYDYIVIDTPPLDVATDSAMISRFADIPIVVVASNSIHKQNLYNSMEKMQSFYTGPIYAILNMTNLGHRYGYFSYGTRKKYYSSRRTSDPAA